MAVTSGREGRVLPEFFSPISVDAGARPRLCVVVDTEEEFEWSAPLSRDNVDVSAIAEVGRLQKVLAPYGLVPTYVIDYPVASTGSSANRLGEFASRGECHIGAHLHPWVTPPFTEAVSRPMSYGCNLGFELEREKISTLHAAIVDGLGLKPKSYKAGRYGFGQSTARILEELDFDIDLSVIPHFDFGDDGGPSFEGFEPHPAAFGIRRRLLEIPLSSGFVGAARQLGPSLHRAASSPLMSRLHAIGILSRTGLSNRVVLSPEGYTFDEMQSLTATLLADGVRTFSLTLHSPSLKPGCTPYAQSEQERDQLVSTIDRYCDYFMNRAGGLPCTPADIFSEMETRAA